MTEKTWQTYSQTMNEEKPLSYDSTQDSTPKKLFFKSPFETDGDFELAQLDQDDLPLSLQDEIRPQISSVCTEHKRQLATRALVQSICFDRPEVVQVMLQDFESEEPFNLDQNRTLLMYAVMRENLVILGYLLRKWCSLLNKTDNQGVTALGYCIEFSKIKSATWLLNQNCELDIQDLLGRTPLHSSAISNQTELFLAIQARGANRCSMDKFGKFPHDYLKESSLRQSLQAKLFADYPELCNSRLRTRYHARLGLMNPGKVETPSLVVKKPAENYCDRFSEQAFQSLVKDKMASRSEQCLLQSFTQRKSQKALLDRRRRFQIHLKPCLLEARDFVVENVLGGGENNPHAISHSYCVKYKWDFLETGRLTPKYLAVKEYPKRLMLTNDRLKYLQLEKKALMNFQHPFILKLISCFQSEEKVYIATEFCQKGDLGSVLQRKTMPIAEVQILAAELILALESLHTQGFSHRDLKPENVLIGGDGHLRLADFGLCHQKTVQKGNQKQYCQQAATTVPPQNERDLTSTFCGTLVYLPPEVLAHKKYKGAAADWYLLGEILYEAVVGYPPFIDHTKEGIKCKILEGKLSFPPACGNSAFKDLVAKLLMKNPKDRIGYKGGAQEIKIHPFFLGVDFDQVFQKNVPLFDPSTLPDIEIKGHNIPLHKATKLLSKLETAQVLKGLDSNADSAEGLSTYSESDSESDEPESDFLELRGWSFVS